MRLSAQQHGFTLPELIMVVVVIGLLCVAVVPFFFMMQNARRQTDMEKVVGIVQAGLLRDQAKAGDPAAPFPAILDHQPAKTACQDCFSTVLEKGVASALWYKVSDSEYHFSRNGNHAGPANYREPGDFRITYDATRGVFSATPFE
jgi:prepilin-type N-terminal cleavage/methylation domain-containing protein